MAQLLFQIAHGRKLLYLNMPKSACTTIKNSLYFMESGSWLEDPLTVHALNEPLEKFERDQDPERVPLDYRSFTIVRHPVRRAYSFYVDKLLGTGKHSLPKIRRHIVRNYGMDFDTPHCLDRERMNFKSALEFMQSVLSHPGSFPMNHHWLPQYMILEEGEKICPIQHIGKVESLRQDLPTILQDSTISKILESKTNSTQTKTFRFNEIVDDNILEMSESLFSEDCRRFDYALNE